MSQEKKHQRSRGDGHDGCHCCACETAQEHNHEHEHEECGCSCGHGGWDKALLIRLGAAALLVAVSFLPFFAGTVHVILLLTAFASAGLPVLWSAVREAFKGQVFNENLLMSIASIGAVCVGEYFEAAMVMILFNVGELLSHRAAENSRRSIVELLDLRPETVRKKVGDEFVETAPERVSVGDIVQVRPGDRVGLDGVVIDGESFIDRSALTGESMPEKVVPGDALLSGCINKNGLLQMRVSAEYGQSTASRIIQLVRETASQKSRSEQFITKFSRYYTPAVAALALLIALLLPLAGSFTYSQSVYTALNFLIISCPCALVISVPLAYFMGIGAAARRGLLVKGGNFLEALNRVDTIAFDKTGTLTEGKFTVSKCVCEQRMSEKELLRLAALAEAGSTHPIARAIVEAYGVAPDTASVRSVKETAGSGVVAEIAEGELRVGTRKLLSEGGVSFMPPPETGTTVYVALNGEYLGCISLADQLKRSAAETVLTLRRLGVKRMLMLTGDNGQNAARIAGRLNITEVRGGLLPSEKVDVMRELLARRPLSKRVMFVGDGINDAPSLALADIGVAMGALGSNAAIEAADAVLMHDELDAIADGIRTARKTNEIVWENIVFSLAVKLAVMVLALLCEIPIIVSVLADVGVALLAVANTLRLYSIGKGK